MNWAYVEKLLHDRYIRQLTQGECDMLGQAVRADRIKYRRLSIKTCVAHGGKRK